MSYSELLADLQEQIERALEDHTQACEIAEVAVETIRKHWGGQQIYIPKGIDLTERDWAIYNEFNGANLRDLARKYNLSTKRVRQIIQTLRLRIRTSSAKT